VSDEADVRVIAEALANLTEAVGLYLDEQGKLPGSPAFRLESRMKTEPPEDIRVILYRIAQEAVTNARKHARADLIRVVLEEDERGHTLRVIDDGNGFDAAGSPESAPGHLGLTAMRERAEMAGGWLGLESVPGEGTTVTVWVPRWDAELTDHGATDHDHPRRASSMGDGERDTSQLVRLGPIPAEPQRAADG